MATAPQLMGGTARFLGRIFLWGTAGVVFALALAAVLWGIVEVASLLDPVKWTAVSFALGLVVAFIWMRRNGGWLGHGADLRRLEYRSAKTARRRSEDGPAAGEEFWNAEGRAAGHHVEVRRSRVGASSAVSQSTPTLAPLAALALALGATVALMSIPVLMITLFVEVPLLNRWLPAGLFLLGFGGSLTACVLGDDSFRNTWEKIGFVSSASLVLPTGISFFL